MTQLVGILNITPDSFSDGGFYGEPSAGLAQADRLFADGAAFVDVGAESTRPGATPVSPVEEWARIAPVFPRLLKTYPGRISLDTRHPETARRALRLAGDVIINDVTGLKNPAMAAVVCRYKARCIVSHSPHVNVQMTHSQPPLDSLHTIIDDLLSTHMMLTSRGVPPGNIIIDPGIGFGKTPRLNEMLISFAAHVPDNTVMIGYSRKRFLGDSRMDLEPNLRAGRVAVTSGAAYLRVHDVRGHRPLVCDTKK